MFRGNKPELEHPELDCSLNQLHNLTKYHHIELNVYFHGTYEENYTNSSGYYNVTNIPICYCMKKCTASKVGYYPEWIMLSITENTTHDFVLISSNILYVGGSGPNNYSKIQDAINDAEKGYTVFVYDDSSPYYESLIINKSLYLIGESKDTTIIDANKQEHADGILIKRGEVTIQGFTIRNTTGGRYPDYDNGIEIWSNNNTITDNIIKNTRMGIQLGEDVKYEGHVNNQSHYNIIEENIITNNTFAGIYILSSNDNQIKRNTIITNQYHGIFLFGDNCRNQIGQNIISNHSQTGIFIHGGSNNTILQNHIIKNNHGITISYSSRNYINYNNIYANSINAFVDADSLNFFISKIKTHERYFSHSWDENYWGRSHLFPKPIISVLILTIPSMIVTPIIESILGILFAFIVPIPQFDWNPVQEPYDIPGLL
jgi:parallel beta-helix repeat protein